MRRLRLSLAFRISVRHICHPNRSTPLTLPRDRQRQILFLPTLRRGALQNCRCLRRTLCRIHYLAYLFCLLKPFGECPALFAFLPSPLFNGSHNTCSCIFCVSVNIVFFYFQSFVSALRTQLTQYFSQVRHL